MPPRVATRAPQIPEDPGLQTLQSFGQDVPLGTGVPIFPGIRLNISGFIDVFSGGALRQDPTTFEYRAQAAETLGVPTPSTLAHPSNERVLMPTIIHTPPATTPSTATRPVRALTDFYLGYESQFFQDNGRSFALRYDSPTMYLSDDWKVTRQFSLNLGVRWEPWLPPIDLNNSLTAFVPGVESTVAPNAPRGLLFPGDPGIPQSVFKQNWKDFAPRVGFACNVGRGPVDRRPFGLWHLLQFPEGLLYQRTDATQPTDLYLSIPAPQSFTDPYLNYPAEIPSRAGMCPPSGFSGLSFHDSGFWRHARSCLQSRLYTELELHG